MDKKILISLVAASIAAMAAAPELLKENKNDTNVNNSENKNDYIKLNQAALNNADPELKENLQKEVNALLNQKSSVMRLSESINSLVDNYGNEDGSIKDNIYKELNLGVNQDSVMTAPTPTYPGLIASTPKYNVCHSACHGACHNACHGSRGWR